MVLFEEPLLSEDLSLFSLDLSEQLLYISEFVLHHLEITGRRTIILYVYLVALAVHVNR